MALGWRGDGLVDPRWWRQLVRVGKIKQIGNDCGAVPESGWTKEKSTDYGNCKLARESEIGVDKNMVRRRAVLAVGLGVGDDRDSRDSEQTSS